MRELLASGRYVACSITLLDAPGSDVDSLRTEGGRLGTTLLVDIDYCSHVVGEKLNAIGLCEGEECPIGKTSGSQLQDVDTHPSFSCCPEALGGVTIQVGTPGSASMERA